MKAEERDLQPSSDKDEKRSTEMFPRELIELLIDGLAEAALITDLDYKLLIINKKASRFLQPSSSNFEGRSVFETIFDISADSPALPGDVMKKAENQDTLFHWNLKNNSKEVDVILSKPSLGDADFFLFKLRDKAVVTEVSLSDKMDETPINSTVISLIESFPHPLFLLDANSGEVVSSNKTAAQLKKEVESVAVSGNAGFFRSTIDTVLSKIRAAGKQIKHECEFLNKSGQKQVYEVIGFPYETADKGHRYAIQCFIDITDKRTSLEELKSYYELREVLLRNIPGVAFRCLNDDYWTMEYVSPGCKRLLGYRVEEMTGPDQVDFSSLIVAEDRDKIRTQVLSSLKRRNYYSIDYHLVAKNGKIKWVQERGRGVYDENGMLIKLEGLITDVTSLKTSEERLIRELTVNKRIADAGIEFLRGQTGLVELAGMIQGYLTKITGSEYSFLVTHNLEKDDYSIYCNQALSGRSESLSVTPERLENSIFWNLIKSKTPVLENEYSYDGELPCIPRRQVKIKRILSVPSAVQKQTNVWIVLANSGMPYSKDSIVMVQRFVNLFAMAIFRIQTEDALRQAKQKAEESDRLKSMFLSNMSHDMRTPMNAIMGFAEMLQDANLGRDEKERFLNAIMKSGDSLLHLINDVVDISKIEAGQLQLIYSECNINGLLDEIELTFRQELEKVGKSHVMFYIQKGIPDDDFSIHSDAIRIKQILSNLVGNAIKFTDEGFIEIGYRIEGGKVLFYVRDSGIGIPTEHQKLVFERFGRVSETLERNAGGTGLGLTITKDLVEMLGGKIWLDSFPGEGSTFWFTLPLQKTPSLKEPKFLKDLKVNRPDLSDSCILVVEDVDTNYFYLSSLLEKLNARVLRAANGQRAVEMCKADSSINLVLMDIELPILNGYDATREIKRLRPGLPVIAQTAYALPGERERCVEAGCDEYLAKPIRKDDLIETIQKFRP